MADREIRPPITRAELAQMLRVSPEWLDRNIARMRRNEGFPAPLLNRMYDPAAVADWQDRRRGLPTSAGPAAAEPAGPAPANDDDTAEIDRARAAMLRRLQGRAS